MQKVALWQIDSQLAAPAVQPQRLHESHVELEKHLEGWIEANPDLLEIGLRVVGRQFQTDAGKIDLLARDPQGTWTIIEVKKGLTTRDALAQALDYAAALAELSSEDLTGRVNAYLSKVSVAETPATGQQDSPDERAIRIVLTGVGSDLGLQRIVNFLQKQAGLQISLVSFSVFAVAGAGQILVREITESVEASTVTPTVMPSLDDHIGETGRADAALGEAFRRVAEAAKLRLLRPRPFKHSVMFAPPSHGNRALFTVWAQPREPGKLTLWIGPEVFEEFFSKPKEQVIELLGPGDWQNLTADELIRFAAGLETLLAPAVGEEGRQPTDVAVT